MPADLDIVGSAGVDVVPVVPNFHNRLRAAVLPAADRVGEDAGRRMGDAISRHITINIPDAVTSGGRRARAVADREGNQVGGAFGRSVKRKLEEAFRSLPRADVRLGDTGINADIDRLRARIQTLSGKTIGIDIDAGAALAEITDIDARLQRLAAENPNVQIRTDTAAARAALAEVQRQINDVDRDDVNVRVEVFSSMPVSEIPDGVTVTANDFAWTRARFGPPTVTAGADMVGTSLVETGVVDGERYLEAVRALAKAHGATRYFAHRREHPDKLRRLAAETGLEIVRPELPLELIARRGPVGRTILSFPSTVVHTLPLALAGTGVRVAVCDIDPSWLTDTASPRAQGFLSGVTGTARDVHRLAAGSSPA